MANKNIVDQAEKQVFRASFEDGMIDFWIAAFALMPAVAPLLSENLGDFLSSAVFLPFWGLLYLLLRWVRKQYVTPRLGSVTFGEARVAKLRRGGTVMVVLNVVFLLLGVVTFLYPGGPGWLVSLRFSAILLIFFSMAGYFYDLPQLFGFGVLLALALPVGEWLWQRGLATHHGFPLIFGTFAVIIFLRGVYKFVRLMRTSQPDFDDQAV